MAERHWQDEGAADWGWHLARVRDPARAERDLAGVATIFCPTEVLTVPMKNRGGAVLRDQHGRPRLKKICRPLFRGYWFVSPMAGRGFWDVERVEGVVGVLRAAGDATRAAVARVRDVAGLMERERTVLIDAAAPVTRRGPKFAAGQAVRLTDGPFAGFAGLVDAAPRGERLRVLVSMFGGETPCEMDVAQLEAA